MAAMAELADARWSVGVHVLRDERMHVTVIPKEVWERKSSAS